MKLDFTPSLGDNPNEDAGEDYPNEYSLQHVVHLSGFERRIVAGIPLCHPERAQCSETEQKHCFNDTRQHFRNCLVIIHRITEKCPEACCHNTEQRPVYGFRLNRKSLTALIGVPLVLSGYAFFV